MCADPKPGKPVPFPQIVALTGFMAAGKSTVVRTLGNLLGWISCDLDYEIECREKLRVREIFERHGEPGFRELETDALHTVLESASAPTVIALGGGTFVQPQNADLLHRCRAASARCPDNPRPLAEDADAFYALHAQRLPSYRRAGLIVNAGPKTAEQIAREIVALLRLIPCKR